MRKIFTILFVVLSITLYAQTSGTTVNATDNLNTGRTAINSNFTALFNSHVFNVKNYGAVGDGTAAGGGTDDTAAITAAIAAMPAAGGVLYFPATGNALGFKITSTITVTKNIRIVGDGKKSFRYYTMNSTPNFGASNIYFTDTDTPCFTFGSGGATNQYPVVSIENISIIYAGATAAVAGSTAIGVTGAISQGLVERCTIEGFYINIDITAGYGWTFDKVTFLAPVQYGLEWSNTTNTDIGWMRIVNCDFISSIVTGQHANAAIHMVSGGAIWIDNIDVNAAATLDTTSYFKYGFICDITAQTSEVIMSDSRITNYLLNGFTVKPVGVSPAEIQVNNCQFAPQTDAAGPAIDIQGTSSNHIIAVAVTNITGQNTPVNSTPFTNFAYIDGLRVDNIVQRAGNWTGGDVVIANCTNINKPMNVSSVNAVSPTSPNRTITVEIDGTTYYIAAKTTNN